MIRFTLALAVAMAIPTMAGASEPQGKSVDMVTEPFTLKPLPYPADALAPVIDAETMNIHHGRHHKAYIDALNKAVAADPKLQGKTLEQLVTNASQYPAVIRNNAGGHWNHAFFWESMTSPEMSGDPSPKLLSAITKSFGSFEKLKVAFKQAGTVRFGSGWVWLVSQADGSLVIGSTQNQDNPLMDVTEIRGTPILGNDVWEHAYYLKYQNRRGDYLDAWWQVVNWKHVSERFEQSLK